MRRLVVWALSFWLCVVAPICALVVHAPEKCGGAHVATHASALFGPSTHDGSLHGVRLFAPRPQNRGKYVTSSSEGPDDDGEAGGVDEEDGLRRSAAHAGALTKSLSASSSPSKPSKETELFDGCKPLSVEKDIALAKDAVVVLVRGPGPCDFERKVRNMQKVGARGVIIVNYQSQGDRLVNMKLNNTSKSDTITIPSLMVLWREWAQLAPCRENNISVSFSAEGEAAFDFDYGREALNWAMMRGMALWIFFQCGVNMVRLKRRHSELTARVDAIEALPVRTYTKRRTTSASASHAAQRRPASSSTATCLADGGSYAAADARKGNTSANSDEDEDDDDDHGTERTRLRGPSQEQPDVPVTQNSVRLPQTSDEDEDEPMCAICIDNFEEGDQVRELECSHIYHKACIDPWLYQSSTCPVCKREIPNLPPTAANAYGSLNV
ncbi:E3 ubiquitin-protein ligase [Porphyridium purpureum]|uniref:E3 ubiquitin-protein ligase n=1 Tax=Porphyridium purpureum TaxID=35688 RepID=A0A5J4YWS7_PORPP|nr:E3 ubiquitin-protein ligase [Porphyridium purpureum]|eukprot:POR9600..scf209_3